MQPTFEDKLAAAVFATALDLGFVRREDAVGWADRRIDGMESAPPWLIELSVSQFRNLGELTGGLRAVGKGVDPVAACRLTFGLIPNTLDLSLDQAEALAKLLYNIAGLSIGDWQNHLVYESDGLGETLSLVRQGYCMQWEAIAKLVQFVETHRDQTMLNVLYPVTPERCVWQF